MRIGVVSVMQETNTFSIRPCRWEDFTVAVGVDATARLQGTNSEFAGALETLAELRVNPVPIFYAWALPSGRVEQEAYERLQQRLGELLTEAGALDGLVLSLHGAMATEVIDDADLGLINTCRRVIGDTPIGVCLDLHANVTEGMVAAADVLIGYRTDPHIDMGETGRRIARLLVALIEGAIAPTGALYKAPMIIPAEAMNTTTGVLAEIRRLADQHNDLLDVSLFPVQPWLDVPEHGFGVVATANGDRSAAVDAAKFLAEEVWKERHRFVVPRFATPAEAFAQARSSAARPFLMAESADAPTAGAAGDSPLMIEAARQYGRGLETMVAVVDPAAVAQCHEAGAGKKITTSVGAGVDSRFARPVPIQGTVERCGDGAFKLEGVGYYGLEVTMGRWAVLRSPGLAILLTERPAMSSDPASFRHAGLDPFATDVLVVKSCSDFRPNFPKSAEEAVTLDVPGAATPRLDLLEFRHGQPWTPPAPPAL
ncbi:MAG TPA: M81 family metallopeptidase [Acidimicrobiia bacterium]|nr:M81 family metallopeptidase [Acidimicrobiia bacterium]